MDLTRTRLQLREDLRFFPQDFSQEPWYHIEVQSTGAYYRIGFEEYVFLSLLDGQTSFSEALAISSRLSGQKALSQARALTVYGWLLENGLGTFSDADMSACGVRTTANIPSSGSSWERLNPLWIRVPFGRPDHVLALAEKALSWLFSPVACLPVIFLLLTAAVLLYDQWEMFADHVPQVFARENWLWLMVTWLGLKLIHELGHGVVCRRYGGTVREAGLVFAMFAPLPYVDATSSWSFSSRMQRIHVAVAGVYLELLAAAAALILWTHTESASGRSLLRNVVVMASLSTLLFNLNPLMKFDGYFVLSDLLQIPNLASRSRDVLLSTCRRVFLGETDRVIETVGSRRWILLSYGLAACCWRGVVCGSLLIGISVLFHGAGLVLAAAGLLLWFVQPLFRELQNLHRVWLHHPERVVRATVISILACACVPVALLIPAPLLTTAPGVVDFEDGEVIRSTTSGFVSAVHVFNGQRVCAGDLLISLSNDELKAECRALEHQLAAETLRLQTASRSHDSGAQNVSEGNIVSLQRRVAECQSRMAALEIRAGRDGVVVSRALQILPGTYASEGMELMTIGFENRKEVRISVCQQDVQTALSQIDQQLTVRIGLHSAVTGTLRRVNPRASRTIPHPALVAINGGALSVEQQPEADSKQHELLLTEPRFSAIVQLSPEAAVTLRSGETGYVSLGLIRQSLGAYLWTNSRQWFRNQLDRVRKAT